MCSHCFLGEATGHPFIIASRSILHLCFIQQRENRINSVHVQFFLECLSSPLDFAQREYSRLWALISSVRVSFTILATYWLVSSELEKKNKRVVAFLLPMLVCRYEQNPGLVRTLERRRKKEMQSLVQQGQSPGAGGDLIGFINTIADTSVFYSNVCCFSLIWHKTQRRNGQDAYSPAKWLACFIRMPRISTQLSSLNIY